MGEEWGVFVHLFTQTWVLIAMGMAKFFRGVVELFDIVK
jgi:hypothetical protein